MATNRPSARLAQEVRRRLAPYSIAPQELRTLKRSLSHYDRDNNPTGIVRVFERVARDCPSAEPAIQAIKDQLGTPLTRETEQKLRHHIARTPIPSGYRFMEERFRAEQLALIPFHTEESAAKFVKSFDVIERTRRKSLELGEKVRTRAMTKEIP